RRDEREERRQADEDRRAGNPPRARKPLREADDDEDCKRQEEELRGEREPAPEHDRDVALVRLVVAPLPPEREDRERDRDQPDEREAEHREQHPRTDRAGSRLAREPRAAPGVQGEDNQRRNGLPEPEPVAELLVVLRAAQEGRREEALLRQSAQVQAVGNLGAHPEEERSRGPRPRERR